MKLRNAVLAIVGVTAALLITSGQATATPTPEYPVDPKAEAASQVYPGPPVGIQPRSAAAFVTVPAGYVYNTNLKPVARHDYCTSAPDTYFAADFTGPCARHDMCYDAADAAGQPYGDCNAALYRDMEVNCAYAYGTSGAPYTTCQATAWIYWAAVTAAHIGQN